MTEPIDDQWTFWHRLQRGGGEFTVTQRLLDEIEDAYGPIGWMREWWDKTYAEALEYFEAPNEPAHTVTTPSLAQQFIDWGDRPAHRVETLHVAAACAAPDREHVTRDLAPLVRQAAADTPVGVVPRLDPDLARLRVYWPQGKPFPQPALADWANKPVTWPSIVGWYRDQERNQHDVDCGCPAHSWWLP